MSETIETAGTTNGGRANWVHFLLSGVILLGSMAFYETSQAEALRREVAQLTRPAGLRQSVLRESQ